MDVDLKAIAKENMKLILSLLALIIVALMMASTKSSEKGVFDYWNASTILKLDGEDNTTGPLVSDEPVESGSGDAIPVSNGKNNFYANEPPSDLDQSLDYSADIQTSMGTISVDLFEDESPNNVNNFVFLAEDGFYSNSSFHRLIQDYIIQGGDPLGNGFGGPGYYLNDEIDSKFRFKPYMVAMANSGADSNGSQFFIISKRANTKSLDGLYTPIGEVVAGFNVIDDMEKVDVDSRYMPYESVVIQNIIIKSE